MAATKNSVVEIEYVHELGLHENKTVNINPSIATGIGTDSSGNQFVIAARPLSAAFAAAGVPVLGRVMDEQSVNRSRYDGLNFSYRQHMTKHFSLNANYTLSRAMGWGVESGSPDATSSFRNYPHDPLNIWDPRDFGRRTMTNAITSRSAASFSCPLDSRWRQSFLMALRAL